MSTQRASPAHALIHYLADIETTLGLSSCRLAVIIRQLASRASAWLRKARRLQKFFGDISVPFGILRSSRCAASRNSEVALVKLIGALRSVSSRRRCSATALFPSLTAPSQATSKNLRSFSRAASRHPRVGASPYHPARIGRPLRVS